MSILVLDSRTARDKENTGCASTRCAYLRRDASLFLNLMEERSLRFHSMFRNTSALRPGYVQGNGEKLGAFVSRPPESTPFPEKFGKVKALAASRHE